MRFLTCNLVFGPVGSAAELNSLAPDLHEMPALSEPPGRRVLMKTHYPFSSNLPLVAHTAGAIYIVRDPADVMLSNFHYSKRTGTTASEGAAAFERYVEEFIAARGDPRWLKLGMGRWDDNVTSWIGSMRDFPVLAIRYEDVLADANKTAQSLCRFLGLERTPQEIAAAVTASSFERLREIEEADIRARRTGIFYKPYLQGPIDAGLRFMRAGRRGEAVQALADGQWRRFDAAFGALRRRLGYG